MEASAVGVPIRDATYLRGEGVFETIRAIGGEPLFFEDHYQRLKKASAFFSFVIPDEKNLHERVRKLLEVNQLQEARIRITLGENCLITTLPLEPESLGAKATLAPQAPINERSPLAGIKCSSYAENMSLLRLAKSDEVLRPNTQGELCEGCLSNVFFIKEGRLFTPSLASGCLPGVMRKQVLACTAVEEGSWPFEVLQEVDEIWLSNSIRRLRYVSEIDGKKMPAPSPLFHELRAKLP